VWTAAAEATKSQVSSQIYSLTLQYNTAPYDDVNIMALAMDEAHSTQGSVYNRYIMGIVNGTPGAVNVSSYAQGMHLLAEGKRIRWDGAEGLQTLTKSHNVSGEFQVQKSTASLNVYAEAPVNNNYLQMVASGH
jgi:hypothetical protein